MNTILLQKILDILTEGLAHVGDFFKDLFISDPQDGQVIGYDADAGKWKNMSVAELELDVTATAGPDDIITFSDAADMPLKSLIANINVEGGTDTVVIMRTGKNLVFGVIEGGSIGSNGTIAGGSTQYDMVYAPIKEGETYTISTNETTNQFVGGYFTSLPTVGSTSYNGERVIQYSMTFTAPITGYVVFRQTQGYGYAQLEIGQTATAYVSPNGTSETITLPSSVTSGYVDVISGAGMSGDTPFTVTPVIINSKTGVNNIFADTGDVTAVYYTKAAGDIKSLVCITEDITSDITKNTTVFSDILLKVSQNNKVVSVEIYSATTSAAVNDTFLSNLPKPAMNSKVLLVNTTLGEDGTILGTLKTTGELEIATSGAKSFSGLITYVAK